MFVSALGIFLSLLMSPTHAQELKRSDPTNRFWLEGAVGNSPDSGIFHGKGSAVADRKDISLRYQSTLFGVVANYHMAQLSSDLDQESYTMNNGIYGLGLTMRWSPFSDKSGVFGGSHFILHVMGQTGRSDYHYNEGPDGGTKAEVTAGIVKATGFALGADYYLAAIYGLWLSAGAGFESNSFDYAITSDRNGNGEVNISQTFTYLRLGLAFSF
jgi:hypothetical protein